jgi:hypothetical protein
LLRRTKEFQLWSKRSVRRHSHKGKPQQAQAH